MRTTLSRSKLELADYYYKYRKNFKAAKVLYNEAITVYPDSAVAIEARQKLDVLDAKLGLLPQGSPAAPKAAPKKKKFWLF
jgi:outer membrane protein assembly factor BamD